MAMNGYMPPQYYPPSLPYRYEQPLGLKGRPVASIEEARASMIDFDGSTFYFPDAAKKNIYTKRINMDGTSSLETYTLQEQPTVPETQYVSMETFQSTINAILTKIDTIAAPQLQAPQVVNIPQPQGGQNNDEQFKF